MRIACLILAAAAPALAQDVPDYDRDVAPILTKYCAGCHNADDKEGGLSLASWADLQKGGENGQVVLAGGVESSRLIRVITGEDEPRMPPEDNEAPTAEEIKVLKAWISAGAAGPNGTSAPRKLMTPQIAPAAAVRKAITALDWSPTDQALAVGKFTTVELLDAQTMKPRWSFTKIEGKVNGVRFSADGRWLAVATGVTGLSGTALLLDTKTGTLVKEFRSHSDTLYAAAVSPDRQLLATAGYDRSIVLWDTQTGKQVRTLKGHNGAVFDIDFDPQGKVLASASADDTIKIWHVASGERLDTRSEPLDEQYAVRFSPDGKLLLGGGADNRVRIWRFVSRNKPRINPLVYARFGHEGPVTHIDFSANGEKLITAAEDQTLKLWETASFTPVHVFEHQPTTVSALALAPTGKRVLAGRIDGSWKAYPVPAAKAESASSKTTMALATPRLSKPAEISSLKEGEPNSKPDTAQAIQVPARISGHIDGSGDSDTDHFRFAAKAGQEWVIEVNAARNKSPLDSRIAVLHPDGSPVPRVLLRAVRDSYFTFRGKNSDIADDFRVHNWEEMELNEFLYANGEVVRLWLYPRGPDSGFKVYPGRGKRHGFFDTTPIAHALHEPCYIVEPYPVGTEFIPNGLPTFTINYENDDDPRRKMGKDSKLFFTVPRDGQYIVRIEDTRGFSGDDYKYELTVRPRQPGFKVRLTGANPTVNPGSGREFSVVADRLDGFEGPIRVDIGGVPDGFYVTTPIIIEAGQEMAFGTINAAPDAKAPSDEKAKATTVTATAFVNREKVQHTVGSLGTIKLAEKKQLLVTLKPNRESGPAVPGRPFELTISPGETITAHVVVERNGMKGRIDFGKDDSGRNLPHGVYVDNIGLNGLMIVDGQSEREFFITAAKWVPETTRMFHLRATAAGGQTSWPVILHVREQPAEITRRDR